MTIPAAAAIRARATIGRRGSLIGCGKPLGRSGPARSITSCRYASITSLSSAHSLSTSLRNQSGSATSGVMPNNAAGRSTPRRRSAQVSHWSMWRLSSFREWAVSRPSGADEQQVEPGAVAPPGAGDEQGAERLFQLAAGAGGQGVRLIPGDAEHRREVGALQVMPQAELEGLPLSRAQPGQGSPDEPAQLGAVGAVVPVGVRAGEVSRRIEPPLRPVSPAAAFVAGHRVQPGAQLARVPQATEHARGDDERVLDGIGRVIRLVQDPAAVTVKGLRVLVIGIGEGTEVACHDGRDNFAVLHALHRS